METNNPYLTIVGVTVDGQSKDSPERHRCVVSIQWPIWSSEETEARFVKRLEVEQNHG